MAKRLVKVAKELNVGTSTIVEHLLNSGFEIENRPTVKITEEMEAELLKEFSKSIAIKEQADLLVIGTRPAARKDAHIGEEPSHSPIVSPPTPASPPSPPPPEEAKVEPKKSEPEPEVVEEKMAPAEEKPKVALKIKGKIDLDKKPGKEKKAPPPKVEKKKTIKEAKAPVPVPEKVQPKEKVQPEEKIQPEEKLKEEHPSKKETKKEPEDNGVTAKEEEKVSNKDKLIKAQAPELRGLKIMGKITVEKEKKPKKKKKVEAKKKVDSAKGSPKSDEKKAKPLGSSDSDDAVRRRRRRTRRRVRPTTVTARDRNAPRNRRGRRNDSDVKEVSKKQIEEKIKSTMARLSGRGKKMRQRLRRDNRERLRERQEQREQEQHSDKLQLTEFVTVQELANLMDVAVTDVITTCMNLGVIVSINQRLDAEIIELVAEEFGHETEFISVEAEAEEEEEIIDAPEDLQPRPPIVTVMGHVDHGKTSLLDFIRKAKVVAGEAGGITQHIGAYEVIVGEEHKKITFLDTPGHEAFTAMRARGAKVTDIAVVIIAADDSIMPQTKEAISHAQAAGVPMIFAINKIDKPGAQPEKIKQELAAMNLLIEEWGGEYQSQDISAKTGEGIDELLEKILLVTELQELKANPDRQVVGTILEASLDKGRGYVAKALVQTGTLHIGDAVVAGEHSGKVKAMFNERGKRVQSAGPSSPVLVLGLSGAPQAGEIFKEMASEAEARQLASRRAQISREQTTRATKRISLDEIGRRLALGTFQELNLIVKGDVDGSVEALSDSLIKQSIETVQVNIIHKAVGQIIESDVLLASASNAIIIGFQVRPSLSARKLAEREGVEIKGYSVIYKAIEEIRAAIEGMLIPTKEERIVCNLEVREIYKISKIGTIAGCMVREGKITRNTKIRIIRNGIVIYPIKEGVVGEISSLKRFKDDVKEVKTGMECGISIKNFNDIKVEDVIEGYEIVEVKQTLV